MPKPALEEVEALARANGLELEWGDHEWLMMRKRIVSLEVRKAGRRVAGASQTYSDDAGRKRAMEFCLGLVYFRP